MATDMLLVAVIVTVETLLVVGVGPRVARRLVKRDVEELLEDQVFPGIEERVETMGARFLRAQEDRIQEARAQIEELQAEAQEQQTEALASQQGAAMSEKGVEARETYAINEDLIRGMLVDKLGEGKGEMAAQLIERVMPHVWKAARRDPNRHGSQLAMAVEWAKGRLEANGAVQGGGRY